MASHYLIDAVTLLEKCIGDVQSLIEESESCRKPHHILYDLREALSTTEHLLFHYVRTLLERDHPAKTFASSEHHSSLLYYVELLRSFKKSTSLEQRRGEARFSQTWNQESTVTDSLLFRLIIALQLCSVRISDVRYSVSGKRLSRSSLIIFETPLLASGAYLLYRFQAFSWNVCNESRRGVLLSCLQGTFILGTALALRAGWRVMLMSTKVGRTLSSIEDWNHRWYAIHRQIDHRTEEKPSLDASKSQRLLQYALRETTPKANLWHSQGEIRFLVLKRAMDVFYASVGTAMRVTGNAETEFGVNWQVTLVTAAVSSFYTLTGARRQAELVTSSSTSAKSLIQHAWGMVSLPALKSISLQASKLLKGAAVADRIEIAGVSCFVLSREPAPELAAAIRRFSRKCGSKGTVHTMSTINEIEEHDPESSFCGSSKPFAKSSTRYRQRDVILHLTGGGFFAHIIASDLPFLLDWSASTNTVVICPEYDLLPEHRFPIALRQIESVYKSLRSDSAVQALGFEANRIILTGESSGGNLAAALCVKLASDLIGEPTCLGNDNEKITEKKSSPILPCALVLSCPVLNLSLEVSHSRVIGNADPVLPSGLISAISDSYVSDVPIDKTDPLVSPFYASDLVLAKFPPTVVFASSNDPLLDDAVVLNERLRGLGVESELRAAQNLPHAYLGLGTAGFPEAQEVQSQLINWLNCQLVRDLEPSKS